MTAVEYMQMQRPIEQQLDARNVLQALGSVPAMMPSSYAGLSPENVARAVGVTASYLGQPQALLEKEQQQAMAQEAQQFQDAMTARKMEQADEAFALDKMVKELQMAHTRQQMALAAAAAGRASQASALAAKEAQMKLAAIQQMNEWNAQYGGQMVGPEGQQVPLGWLAQNKGLVPLFKPAQQTASAQNAAALRDTYSQVYPNATTDDLDILQYISPDTLARIRLQSYRDVGEGMGQLDPDEVKWPKADSITGAALGLSPGLLSKQPSVTDTIPKTPIQVTLPPPKQNKVQVSPTDIDALTKSFLDSMNRSVNRNTKKSSKPTVQIEEF